MRKLAIITILVLSINLGWIVLRPYLNNYNNTPDPLNSSDPIAEGWCTPDIVFARMNRPRCRKLNNFDNDQMYVVGRTIERYNEQATDDMFYINHIATYGHGVVHENHFALWRCGDGDTSDFWNMLDSMRLHHRR